MIDPDTGQEVEEAQDWMTTYADAITLLMAFFVMLLNFTEYDVPAFQEAMTEIQNAVGHKETLSPTELMKIDIEDVVYNMQAEEAITVGTDAKGIVMELASSAFYKPGSADIRPQAVPVLLELAKSLTAPRYMTYVVEIEGHSDDDPISTPRFPSNWELSSGRATRVVRYFIKQGMDMRRLKAAGYAETRPKVPNRKPDGTPIPENQATNRRVLIRVYPMTMEERADMMQEVDVNEFAAQKGEEPPTEEPEAAEELKQE
jgi:chemotaxis protein MotB